MKFVRIFRSQNFLTSVLRSSQKNSSVAFSEEDSLLLVGSPLGFSGQEILIDTHSEKNTNQLYVSASPQRSKNFQEKKSAKGKSMTNTDNRISLNKLMESHKLAYAQTKESLCRYLRENQKEQHEENLDIANVYAELGKLSYSEKKFADAISYYQKSLEIKQSKLGYYHAEVNSTLRSLGSIYHSYGMRDMAIEHFELSLITQDSSSRVMDEAKEATALSIYNDMIAVYKTSGNNKRALEVSHEVLKKFLRLKLTKTPEAAAFFESYGALCFSSDQYENALEALTTAEEIYLHLNQSNSLEAASVLHNIGLVKEALGEFDEALEYLNKSLKISKKWMKKEPQDLTSIYTTIGTLYYQRKEPQKAINALQKALAYQESDMYRNDTILARIYHTCGLAFLAQKSYTKALKNLRLSQEVSLETLGTHPNMANTYFNIGAILLNQGKYSQAVEEFKKSVEIEEKLKPVNDLTIAKLYDHLGKAYHGLHQNDKALECYKKGLEYRIQVLGEIHMDVANSYNNIGFIHFTNKEYEEALSYFKKSLVICGQDGQNSTFSQQTWSLIETISSLMSSPKDGNETKESLM